VGIALQRVAHSEQLYREFVADLAAHVKALVALGISIPAGARGDCPTSPTFEQDYPSLRSGMGPVAQLVFKTGAVV